MLTAKDYQILDTLLNWFSLTKLSLFSKQWNSLLNNCNNWLKPTPSKS
jgi:hypothetical protein